MAATALADASFLVSLLDRRDGYHKWASAVAAQYPPPWRTCEAALSEALYLLGPHGKIAFAELLHRGALLVTFAFQPEREHVIALMKKYSEVPMSFADACLVRMSEIAANPIVLTTDTDFRIYRRHSRQSVPSIMPR